MENNVLKMEAETIKAVFQFSPFDLKVNEQKALLFEINEESWGI